MPIRSLIAILSIGAVIVWPGVAASAEHLSRIASEDVRERVEEALIGRFGSGSRPQTGYVANVTFTNVYLADGVWDRLQSNEDAWRTVEAGVTALPASRHPRRPRTSPRRSRTPQALPCRRSTGGS